MQLSPVLTCYGLTLFSVALYAAQVRLGDSRSMSGTGCAASFSQIWHVVGPFQIGTREAAWGVDPLERHGGFQNLEFDQHAAFSSSLTANATVGWSEAHGQDVHSPGAFASSQLELEFSNVDWEFQRSVYGWAALQFQAWARCNITVEGNVTQAFTLFTDQVLEFRVDGALFWGGDFYSYRKSPPVLHLAPGVHRLDLRLIRDIRAHGGSLPPVIEARVELHPQIAPVTVGEHRVFPDAVSSRLSSDLASVAVRNNGHSTIFVRDISLTNNPGQTILLRQSLQISPGQTRPVAFRLQLGAESSLDLEFNLRIHDASNKEHDVEIKFKHSLDRRKISEPHKFTYLHPGGIVSYALLRPPPQVGETSPHPIEKLPVLISLHGAGVEADSPALRHSLDATSDLAAWTLFPTGVNPWSSDDWHTWGFADVEAAIAAIPYWIECVDWIGRRVDTSKWLVTGHSNGGQGTWYLATHRPDNVFAAVPASAYSSIQQYVPYLFWTETDPFRIAPVQAALASYRHELLLSNCEDIPMLLQHGGKDDNVPVFHSRRMVDLARQQGNSTVLHEVLGKPHYWDGIMTTEPLLNFYSKHLGQDQNRLTTRTNFTLTVANPRNMGSKGGFLVLQLIQPGLIGWLEVKRVSNGTTVLKTSNIRSFSVILESLSIGDLFIDDKKFSHTDFPEESKTTLWFNLDEHKMWKISSHEDFESSHLSPGGMEAIMQSEGRFVIVYKQPEVSHLALQVARNLYQYFSADAEIMGDEQHLDSTTGNVISLGFGVDGIISSNTTRQSLQLHSKGIRIRDDVGRLREYQAEENGLFTIYLRQSDKGRLELVLWGTDQHSLETVSRLVPMMTGVGQPDFVIADNSIASKGLGGVLAMGFFDADWNVSRTSFLT